jgi:hypothetical protein
MVVGLGRFELPTHGLGNHLRSVPPVWNHAFSVGYDASHSGPAPQFGHEYAPHYAPRPDPVPPSPSSGGFVPISSLLPPIKISKRQHKHLDAIQLIREQRDQNRQELAYNARPFVLCGIPLRRPPQSQTVHARRNGRFFLEISAHPRFGLPHGQDRLIPIWVATLALRQKSRSVHFDSAAQMLDFFRLAKDGFHYRRIVEGFQRVFAATIFFGTEGEPARASVLDWSRFHFFDRMQLWCNHTEEVTSSSVPTDNTITLSEAFYREIDQHRIPVEREVAAALAHAPGALDFYVWIVWRTWAINGKLDRIPLFGNHGLKEQLGTGDYSLDRYFRRKINAWLRWVKCLWPECPASISTDGHFLLLSSSKAVPAINRIQ